MASSKDEDRVRVAPPYPQQVLSARWLRRRFFHVFDNLNSVQQCCDCGTFVSREWYVAYPRELVNLSQVLEDTFRSDGAPETHAAR